MKSSSRCPTARFLQSRTDSLSLLFTLALSISVRGSWETVYARSYAARMRALRVFLRSFSSSSFSTTAKQLSLTVEDETGPQRQPRGTFLSVSSSVFAEQWLTSGKKKKPPSPLSFLPPLTEPDGWVWFFRAIAARPCFSVRAVTGKAPTGSCSGSHRSSCPPPSALGIWVAGTEDSAQ